MKCTNRIIELTTQQNLHFWLCRMMSWLLLIKEGVCAALVFQCCFQHGGPQLIFGQTWEWLWCNRNNSKVAWFILLGKVPGHSHQVPIFSLYSTDNWIAIRVSDWPIWLQTLHKVYLCNCCKACTLVCWWHITLCVLCPWRHWIRSVPHGSLHWGYSPVDTWK